MRAAVREPPRTVDAVELTPRVLAIATASLLMLGPLGFILGLSFVPLMILAQAPAQKARNSGGGAPASGACT